MDIVDYAPQTKALVLVSAYNPQWPRRFSAIAAQLRPALEGLTVQIEHVGSTAVPGLSAKPIIDVLVLPNEMRAFPEVRRRYAALKARLAREHAQDRGAYTDAKTAFIRDALAQASSAG